MLASLTPRVRLRLRIERSRARLLSAVHGAGSVVLFRAWGNIGDDLIYAGARRLLRGVPFTELSLRDDPPARGDLAVISGSGGWCGPFHGMPSRLRAIEPRFERVVVLPSSFDVRVDEVRETLARTRALVFAREHESWRAVKDLCASQLALDTAFFFDYRPYRLRGSGLLEAFRTDAESAVTSPLPPTNRDISVTCSSLDEWLWTIARHRAVHTDRAHVTIAAAMLDKQVQVMANSYHKVMGIAEWAFPGIVTPLSLHQHD